MTNFVVRECRNPRLRGDGNVEMNLEILSDIPLHLASIVTSPVLAYQRRRFGPTSPPFSPY